MKRTQQEENDLIGATAEVQAEAQLEVIRTLRKLDGDSRRRVMEASGLILQAEERVPGIMNALIAKVEK